MEIVRDNLNYESFNFYRDGKFVMNIRRSSERYVINTKTHFTVKEMLDAFNSINKLYPDGDLAVWHFDSGISQLVKGY